MLLAAGIQVNCIAIAILVMLYFGGRQSGVRSYDQSEFTRMLLLVTLVLVCDVACYMLDGVPGHPAYMWHVIANLLYYALHPIACFLWALYSDFKLFGDEAALKKRRWLYAIPVVLCEAMIVASLRTD